MKVQLHQTRLLFDAIHFLPNIDAIRFNFSPGVYQCGPASLEAIRRGVAGFRYDVPFLVASVNADLVRWKEDSASDLGYAKIDTNNY